MDKPIKNHRHFATTLLALYDLPHQATFREVYDAVGIERALRQDVNIASMLGYIHPAMQAALRRDFPTLAEAVMDGELVIDGEPYVQKLSNPPSISQIGHSDQATAAATAISASAIDRADIERIRRAKDAMKWARSQFWGRAILEGAQFDFAVSGINRALGELEMIVPTQDREAE